MVDVIQELDVVALTEDLPEHELKQGQMGTIVHLLAPGVFEVEFVDDRGKTHAMLTLHSEQLRPVHPE
jgi:hypothetical protein